MHFKSFVIPATSLASLASALVVGDLVGTTVNTAVDTVGTAVDTTKPVIDSLIGSPQVGGGAQRQTCVAILTDYRSFKLREKDIAAIRKKYNDVNNELIIKQKPVEYQSRFKYTGTRSKCMEL
ncbi:hypothetical protein C0993_010253 [Termitomyces sp. T159_Od127]|nr:hypothetical protein C0993_010253 [Termitomyces sp. T159_Od127]